ncbi:MAG: hypothetical protein JOZ05_21935 [Acetobacteraceae bacterium]|nr:hypothetical protein [Acetobacteraceae bacterium]
MSWPSWVHEFNPTRSVTAALIGAPSVPFRSLGTSALRDSALTTLDTKLSLTHNVARLGRLPAVSPGLDRGLADLAAYR